MVDAAHFIGLVAGGAIPSPVPYADVVCFTTHKVLRGPRGGMILCREELAAAHRQGGVPVHPGRPAHARGRGEGGGAEGGGPRRRSRTYARQVVANARALADGLAAEGMRPVSGGTDTHLALIDLRGPDGDRAVTGRDAEERCDPARITLNKNAIPYDPQKPMVASGIRVGTPSVTTQGMREAEMRQIAALIARAVARRPGHRGRPDRPGRRGRRGLRPGGQFPAYPALRAASPRR